MLKILISFLIWTLIALPFTLFGFFIIPIMLLCGWKGYSTIWGNDIYGTGETNSAWLGKTGLWNNWVWLAFRNPINNLATRYMAITFKPYTLVSGNLTIGDKIAPGSYWIKMGWAWEYYLIKSYKLFGTPRCIRFRAGWKITGRVANGKVAFEFAFNPVKPYSGS